MIESIVHNTKRRPTESSESALFISRQCCGEPTSAACCQFMLIPVSSGQFRLVHESIEQQLVSAIGLRPVLGAETNHDYAALAVGHRHHG